jgi:hypothetical protein
MFDSMMELSENRKMDGAVDRPELMVRSHDFDLSPEMRSELEDFVYEHTPCRHKFTDNRGQRGIVYFDERNRAADCLIGEMAASELLRQARIHGHKGDGHAPGVGDTAHGTGAMTSDRTGSAGYNIHPRTEDEDIPASEVPDPADPDADYMKLARRMVRRIREQSAPRSSVTARKKADGNILISVDAHTPLVIDSDGYVYETKHGHVNPMHRLGHIRDLIETGFDFKLNALNYSGHPQQITNHSAVQAIGEDVVNAITDERLREAAAKLRESFGGYQFDAMRAWVIGVDRYTLGQLTDTGTLKKVGDQYQIIPLRQESVVYDRERVLDEGWGVLAEDSGWKTSGGNRRAEPVSSSDYDRVNKIGMSFWFTGFDKMVGADKAVSSWNVLVDDEKVYKATERYLKMMRGFDKHSRTWRAGLNLFKERHGKIDIARLVKDVRAGLAKGRKLNAAFEKLLPMVKAAAESAGDPTDYTNEDYNIRDSRAGYRVFIQTGNDLVKALEAIK